MARSYRVLGHSENHDQHGRQIVTGRADYAGDRLPGKKLFGTLVLSRIAHGTVLNIDSNLALVVPGVKTIITNKDCPIWGTRVFQWGQEVAGVVADDLDTARAASRLVKIEYDTLPAAIDPDEAMKEGSPLSEVYPGRNLHEVSSLSRGNLDIGLAASDIVLETAQPWSPTYQHHTLEPHQAVAWWIGEEVYFWTPSQHIHSARNYVASALKLSLIQTHAYTHFTGSGLGDKNTANAAIIAAVMSRSVGGLPVYFIENRRDNALVNTRQFAVKSNITLGAKKDGTLTVIDASFWGDGGRNPMAPMGYVYHGLRTTYNCPDARFRVNMVNTNTPVRAFWRCVNDPPGAFNYDIALDKLADRLGINPYELRMTNLRAAEAPDQDPPFQVWSGNGIAQCFEKVFHLSGYDLKWHEPGTKTLPDSRLHGIAITGHLDSHGSVARTLRGAIITLTPDGKCFLNIGSARGSDGSLTACAHITAETLGLDYNDVSCGEWGNTDISLDAGMQAGSTFTASAGAAFMTAAQNARDKLLAAAVLKGPFNSMGATAADLDTEGGFVFLKNDSSYRLSFRQVMAGSPPIAGIGVGWEPTLRSHQIGGAPIGSPCNSSGSAAACAEVAVDSETGQVEILGMVNVVDTGRTIFKQGTIKQMNSGCELMIGQALFYGDKYDYASGALLTTNYAEATFPTTLDIDPGHFYVQDVESDDAAGPYGAHGIGEPSVTNYSAIICAIFNATGKWVDPDKGGCTPDRVLEALGKARSIR